MAKSIGNQLKKVLRVHIKNVLNCMSVESRERQSKAITEKVIFGYKRNFPTLNFILILIYQYVGITIAGVSTSSTHKHILEYSRRGRH